MLAELGGLDAERSSGAYYDERVKYRRIVAKFGTSLLTAGSDRLDLEAMSRLVGQVARLRAAGCQVVVVSSGAQAAGRHRLAKWLQPGKTPSRQAFASVGQSHLMQSWDELFEWHDIVVAQVLLTRRDLADRLGYLNARNTLRDLLEAGTVPVVNENDAVALDEVLATRIGENDSLSAYVANLIDADLLVMLTDVDGLYDADPHEVPDAAFIERVDRIDADLERTAGGTRGHGSGGMATKVQAARIATQAGVDVVVASGRVPDILHGVASGEGRGTFFPAAASRLESRKRWILGSVSTSGHIVVDAGAASALRAQGRSLLPAGVADVLGAFDRGESVEVRDPEGQRVAAGMTNYGSDEIGRIRGLRSDRIAETLGYAYGEEIIHRDNLVVL
jgi:glutamate 5-kinase